jgi:RimJ/RimL family protein N-acetyltransferase
MATDAPHLHPLVDSGTAVGYEPFWIHLKVWSKESLYNWLFQTYWRRKREYPELLELPEHEHLKLIRFKHPKETDEWLESLKSVLHESWKNSRKQGCGRTPAPLFSGLSWSFRDLLTVKQPASNNLMENVLNLNFTKLTEPTTEYLEALNKWENDPVLIPFMRVCQNEEDIRKRTQVTLESLRQRLEHDKTWSIHLNGQLIGEMGYQMDPKHLYKKEPGTAWIGITIGEEIGRGKGAGFLALQYLGLRRIELGVFEFNTRAIKLYQKLGYREFARIDDFTYWEDRTWQDIRMEKYL